MEVRKGGRSKMNKYQSQPGCSRMKPLKRCKMKECPNVVLIDIDDDDVIVVDSPESSHRKQGGSSEVRENQRVSPQSVISIEDDDESYTNHFSAHEEGGFTEFESDATSSQRLRQAYGIPRHAGPHRNGESACPRNSSSRNCYRFGDDEYEYEPMEVDSDCEVMEDSSGKLREKWEKAASQKKVNGHKVHFGPKGSRSAAVRQKDTAGPFSEVLSCSGTDVPFTHSKTPSTYNVVSEENPMRGVQDDLFPEFDWWNLGGRSSSKKPVSSDKSDFFREKNDKSLGGVSSGNHPSHNNVGGPSLGLNRDGINGQFSGNPLETEGTHWGCSSDTRPGYKMNINQIDSSISRDMNASCSHGDAYFGNRIDGEHVHTAHVECDCIFPSYCACRRSRDLGVEEEHMEEQAPIRIPFEEKSNRSKAAFDNNIGNETKSFSVGTDCEANCGENGSREKDRELENPYYSDTVVRQNSYLASEGPAVETDNNCVPDGGKYDMPASEGEIQTLRLDIINDKEKLKETEEYKRAMEQELALREQQIKLQAEEAQKLRKRKKAEIMRLVNMEKRQKQRLEEVRASQKQDAANLNLKEQLRSEIIKELKVLEMRCFDMASLLRCLGVQVEGGMHPSPQQVHRAYKRAVLKFHPDRTSGSSLKQQVEAEEKFKLISRMKEKYKLQ